MGEMADSGRYQRFAYDADVGFGGGVSEESQVLDWEDGLPGGEDLSPLSLLLVPPELAFAFSIPPADFKTNIDVNRATQKTISSLKLCLSPSLLGTPKLFGVGASTGDDCPMFLEAEEAEEAEDLTLLDTPRTVERLLEHGYKEAVDSATLPGEKSVDDQRTLKRPRLAWTPQLHKRFVDVVTHLGIRNVVPKTIMELMNVEGLTRENVASHLQKYRIYVKRMQGYSNESSSDHIFASTTVPQNLPEQQQLSKLVQVPYTMPVPIYSIPHQYSHGMVPFNNYQGVAGYNGFDSHHSYGLNNWSGASMFGSIISYPHVSYNDNRSSETEKKKPNDK